MVNKALTAKSKNLYTVGLFFSSSLWTFLNDFFLFKYKLTPSRQTNGRQGQDNDVKKLSTVGLFFANYFFFKIHFSKAFIALSLFFLAPSLLQWLCYTDNSTEKIISFPYYARPSSLGAGLTQIKINCRNLPFKNGIFTKLTNMAPLKYPLSTHKYSN